VKTHMKLFHLIVKPAWVAGFKIITCGGESCGRWLTLRHISARKAGIGMRDRWYCSSRCFAIAAEEQFWQLLASGLVHANHVSRMPLGLILISRGLLTNEQLREALDEQKQAGGEIGEILVRRGVVSEKEVTAVRATQWGCPVFGASKRMLQTEIQIPLTLIELYSMIPLHYVAATNRLLVGFVHGIEYGLLYAVEQMTGCKTQPCFVTPSEFQIQMQKREKLEKQNEDATPNEMKFESVQTPAEMARILCKYAFDSEADEAVIGKCRDYLWARLKCGSKAVDLLFKAG
jgi:hypothetical protein